MKGQKCQVNPVDYSERGESSQIVCQPSGSTETRQNQVLPDPVTQYVADLSSLGQVSSRPIGSETIHQPRALNLIFRSGNVLMSGLRNQMSPMFEFLTGE